MVSVVVIAVVVDLVLLSVSPTSSTPSQKAWVQPRFAIGGYFPQFLDGAGPANYAPLAAANFTIALFGGNITQCKTHGLGCIPTELPDTPGIDDPSSLWGYNVGDEPGLYQFSQHAAVFQKIREYRPGSMGFANLLETYCPSSSLASNPAAPPNATLNNSIVYEDYVQRYIDEVNPDFLCTDYYPYMEPWNQFPFANRLNIHTQGRGLQNMENYLANLLILRSAALKHNLNFWNYFGAAAFQGHTMVTEVQMKQQMMISITSGAKGLLYWVVGKGDAYGWASEPRVGRHWSQATRLNSVVLALGSTLMKFQSDSVTRIPKDSIPGGGLESNGVVTMVQETLGCSFNTGEDVVNQGGVDTTNNPTCSGGYNYMRCIGVRNAAAALQPPASATIGANSANGWCLQDNYTEDECSLLCDAYHHTASTSALVCASYDWDPASGHCCVNPFGKHLYLQSVPSSSVSSGVVHGVKIAIEPTDNQPTPSTTSTAWSCPDVSPTTCPPNNTSPACDDYASSIGNVVVGHDFLLSTSTHIDGRRGFTLMNWDTMMSAGPTIVIPSATVNSSAFPHKSPLYEVDPETGDEILAVDDIPTLPGLQILLDVAEARVFLIGKAPVL